MYRKTATLAAAAIVALVAGSFGSVQPAYAVCDRGERLDNSTAAEAKRKIEAAGYSQARDLKKGCDNYWHAIVVKGGAPMRVVLSPQGEVLVEKD